MEFFKPGVSYDFMKYRNPAVGGSLLVCALAALSLFWPGLNYGIDFSGGTELQVQFQGDVESAELRELLTNTLHIESPDVIAVPERENTYIIRTRETTTLPEGIDETINAQLAESLDVETLAVRVSPGGDKVSMRFAGDADVATVREALTTAGVEVRGDVRRFGPEGDHRYEADLVGVADHMIAQLTEHLGERAPREPDRVEWVGPRAGEQLRYAALRALLYSIAFIMVYVAFRFDLRFAPGGIIALAHDALFTVGVFVLVQREFNLTIVAALLTIIGYSINDTIVVFDRIRENLGRYRDKTLHEIINISTSQTLGRTIMTSVMTMLSITPFMIWGTQTIQDISFTMLVGFAVGTYSSIYVAAPVTEWMDSYFRRRGEEARARAAAHKPAARPSRGARA
jgi:preprotein translocase subunit SecF